MKRLLVISALLCAGASPGGCGGGGGPGGNAGGAIAPGQPLEIPFGNYLIIAYHANGFFEATGGQSFMYAAELRDQIAANGPVFVLDVRSAAAFSVEGHIPTAVNVPAAELFTSGGLAQLPVDGTWIVVVGADDHTGSLVAGVLGTMGYPARALRYGIMGWKSSSSIQVASATQMPQTIHGLGLPLVK